MRNIVIQKNDASYFIHVNVAGQRKHRREGGRS